MKMHRQEEGGSLLNVASTAVVRFIAQRALRRGIQRPVASLFFLLLCVLLLCANPLGTAASDQPPPLPIEEMRAAVYTKAFAKRFALPEPEPGTEPEGGIEAMEFAVEPSNNAPYYYCKLYVYLDNKLPVAYPEGETGLAHLPSRRTQLMTFDAQKRWLALSEKDRWHFNERKGRYNRMTMLASPAYDHAEYLKNPPAEPYGAVDMFYEEYHRDLFPGLAYLKIDMGCPAYSWVDKIETAQIWLKREGAKDYRKHLRMERQDFLKFSLPKDFYRQIIRWVKQTAAYNRPLLEEHQRKSKDAAK